MGRVRRGFVTQVGMDYREAIPKAGEMGLDYVELLMEGENDRERLASEATEVATLAEVNGVGLSVHLPMRVDVASPYEHVRDGSILEVKAALDAAAKVDADHAVLHASTGAWRPAHDDAELRDALVASVRHLDDYAADRGITLCVENLTGDFFTLREHFPRLFEETDASVCLDTGHAHVEGLAAVDQAALLMERGDRIDHLHLNDTRSRDDDEHLPFGSGLVDFERLLDPVRGDWSGSLSLEVFTEDYRYVEESLRRLDEVL